MTRRLAFWATAFFLLTFAPAGRAQEFEVGGQVEFVFRIRPDGSDLGIPLHPEIGDRAVSARLPSGSSAAILELGGERANWLKVRGTNAEGWVVTRYVAAAADPPDPVQPAVGETAVFGCWNLEHFKVDSDRGFPENRQGGPSYPPRTGDQVGAIAHGIVSDIGSSLLVLSEIGGRTGLDEDGEEMPMSDELDGLLTRLPAGWTYELSWSGRSQRVAILYDARSVLMNELMEFVVDPRRIQGDDIFARDPLAAHVTLIDAQGLPRNDLVVVGVHLASGQSGNRNHDAAMEVLLARLQAAQAEGALGGPNERDVLVMGDFNANPFRPPVENFFLEMDREDGDWDLLIHDDYPATRLSGVPLGQRTSQIDFIIATRSRAGHAGLSGEEILLSSALVHDALIAAHGGPDAFRRDLSDHIPVTIEIALTEDGDAME